MLANVIHFGWQYLHIQALNSLFYKQIFYVRKLHETKRRFKNVYYYR